MGKLVTGTIPNMIGGVSRQPWNVRLPTQCAEQVNCVNSVTEFMRRRPATRHIATLFDSQTPLHEDGMAMHSINRDASEQYICVFSKDNVSVFDLDGDKKDVSVTDSGKAYLSAMQGNPRASLSFLTINDYTFVLNRDVVVKKAAGETTPKRNYEALVFVKQADYNTTYSLKVNGVTRSFATADGISEAGQKADSLSSASIANNIMPTQATQTAHGITARRVGSTIWLHSETQFTVESSDTRSNMNIVEHRDKVQRFSDLPTIAPAGYTIEVTGEASSNFDNYYVKFVCNDESVTFGQGYWLETVKPGIDCAIDPATMPHALVRKEDGAFSFEPLDWTKRVCGDDESAPFPSFVDRKINGMFFYRNRLAFLSGENVVMSEAGEFFNFFVTTVTAMLDSDVIDVAASNTKDSVLHHAAVFSGGLLLFSAQGQFYLEHDTVLANSTVSIRPVTEFESSIACPPVSSGKTVFFTTSRGGYGSVREYVTYPGETDQNDAVNITAHVPDYINGKITAMTCSTNEDILLCQTDKTPNDVYVYQYFWNGEEKIQSAWCKWTFTGEVLGLAFFGTDIYMAMRYPRTGDTTLENMSLMPGHTDEGCDIEFCLDRKVAIPQSHRIIDMDDRSTTIILPYALPPLVAATMPLCAVDKATGYEYPVIATSASTAKIKGIPGGDAILLAGFAFESRYTFTTPAIRPDNNSNAITDGRLQLRRLTVTCHNTGYIEARVSRGFRPPDIHRLTTRGLGHGSNILGGYTLKNGRLSIPLLSLNTNVSIDMVSAHPLPFALSMAEWEGFHNARASRV